MRLSFGRYLAYDSVIHRMDPRIKLCMIIAMIAAVFFPDAFTGYVILGVVIFTLYFMSKLKVRLLYLLSRPILFMVVVLFIVNCFLIKDSAEGALGWHWGGDNGGVSWFVVSEKSIYQALYLGIRIYYMITLTTILTSTTKPLDMTLGLESILSPLKIVRFPVHIISTIISIALRMIPTLIDEAGRIMKAQASRGIDFKNGKFNEKIKSAVSLIIPLLVSAFQKAEDLSYAMDARGYNPKAHRTRYRILEFNWKDWVIFFVVVGIIAFELVEIYVSFIPQSATLYYLDKFIHI